MNISVDILLGFLSGFSVTFVFCVMGALIGATIKASKNQEKINTKKLIASVVFSTFLMCGIAQYIEMNLQVYAILCVICGMWGKQIINAFLNEKFLSNLFTNIAKLITSPVVKEIAKTASVAISSDDESEDNSKEKVITNDAQESNICENNKNEQTK